MDFKTGLESRLEKDCLAEFGCGRGGKSLSSKVQHNPCALS